MLAACGAKDNAPPAPPPAPVSVMKATAQDVPVSYEFIGQVAGFRDVEVRARVGGILQKRLYTEGRLVKAGEPLFQIDPAPFVTEVDQSRAALAVQKAPLTRAELDYKRIVPLFAENAVSQKDRDDALSAYESAKAAVNQAQAKLSQDQINLGYTKVTAPITGMASKETVSEGNLIVANSAEGSLLTTVSQIDPIYVNFSISDNDALRYRTQIANGQLVVPQGEKYQVTVQLSDGSNYSRTGWMNFTDNIIDTTTGTIRARATFKNPDGHLLPGQFVRVHLEGAHLKDAIVIPQRAVLSTQQGNIVFTVTPDGKAAPRPVEKGQEIGDNVAILKGLKSGDTVIVDGAVKAKPGQPVKILPARTDGKPAALPPATGTAAAPAAGNEKKPAN